LKVSELRVMHGHPEDKPKLYSHECCFFPLLGYIPMTILYSHILIGTAYWTSAFMDGHCS